MAFLIVNGTTIPTQSTNATEDEEHRQGQIRYSHNGGLLCSLRTPKRVWSFSTRPLKLAEIGAILSALSGFEAKVVSGDGIGGSISVLILINRKPYIQDGLLHQRLIDFTIYEI